MSCRLSAGLEKSWNSSLPISQVNLSWTTGRRFSRALIMFSYFEEETLMGYKVTNFEWYNIIVVFKRLIISKQQWSFACEAITFNNTAGFKWLTNVITPTNSQPGQTALRTNQNSPIRPTLVRVFLCPYVVLIPILGFIPDGIIGYENFTVV